MSCGLSLGKGITLNEIISSRNSVTEGVATAPVLEAMAKKLNVDMPICKAMSQILSGKVSIDEAIKQLLSREITTEI
jgi:glycerol-3-phosphate dehydrogenase (NAD(P)+)